MTPQTRATLGIGIVLCGIVFESCLLLVLGIYLLGSS